MRVKLQVMTDSLRIGKRAFTVAVATMTALWSIGLSAFVTPLTAHAASAGSLIKGTTLSTVYYLGSDGSRYAFPNEKAYFTWYTDFSGVQTMSDSALAAIPLAGNIVYRPGSHWIKIQSDPKTYAVTPQGQIRWIETEAVAQGLAGANWNKFIDDVADVFFVDYTVGASLTSASNGYNGMLLSNGGNNWLIWNGQKRMVSTAGFTANRFQTRFVLPGSGVNVAGIAAGSDVTGAESALTDTAQLGGTNSVTGGLSVSLASDTPASATIPAGAASVPFAKFKLTGSTGSTTINQITVTLGGVGSTADIDKVYLYNGALRLTDGRTINSTTRSATFSALNLNLNAGDTDWIYVRADIAAVPTAGDTASFSIASSSDIQGTATVSGNFPVAGNTMTFSQTKAGTLTIDKNGTVSNPTIGQKGAIIAKFSAAASGEDANLKQVTLHVDRSADHSNYQLWKGTTLLANGVVGSKELVSFSLTNPLVIADGNTTNLQVSADVGGRSGDNILVAVSEKADVTAVGSKFGFNMAVDIAGYDDDTSATCAGTGDNCSFSSIQGGKLTFAFNGPASDDVQIDGKDQVIMKFTVTAEEAVLLKEFHVTLDCLVGGAVGAGDCNNGNDDGGLINHTKTTANLSDLTIRKADGTAWMGPVELSTTETGANDTTQTLTYNDNQNLAAGESDDLMLTADISNNAVANDQVRATILMNTVDAEDSNGDSLATTDIIPGANIVGNIFTLTNHSLDVTVSNPPSSGTFVKGSNNVDVVGYAFKAGTSSDVTVTDLTLNSAGDTDATFTGNVNENDVLVQDHFSSCSLYDANTGSLVDGPESPDTTTNHQLIFTSFNWTVPAGETGKLLLRCNLSNTDLDGGNNDAYSFFIPADTAITAQDQNGNNLGAADINSTAVTVANVSSIPKITVTSTGTLAISLDGSTAKSTIVLGASTGVATSSFKFSASNEAFIVKKITLQNCVGTDSTDSGACDTAFGADQATAAVKISYLDQSGNTVTSTGFLSSGSVTFSGMSMYVPTEATRTLTVTVDTNAVSSTAATSGSQYQLNLNMKDGESTFEATGAGSGTTLTETDQDQYVAANAMTIRKTKPTISLASGSPSGAGVPGLSEVLRFNVAADSRGFVTLDQVLFKVTSSDNSATPTAWNQATNFADPTKWELYDINDPSTKLDDDGDWTFLTSTGATAATTDVVAFARLNFLGSATTPAEEIGAGSTKTYVLRADTTGASGANDDSIRIDIPDETQADALGTAQDAIHWEDDTQTPANGGAGVSPDCDTNTSTACIDGSLVKNLPVTGGTIVY
jgi:hypothetical protein